MSAPRKNVFVPKKSVSLKRLFELERRGRYETALNQIADDWAAPEFLPDTSNYSQTEGAELLLRFAALLGFSDQNAGAGDVQQRAKDILTGARARFNDLGDFQKQAECDNYVALCYWRTGELNEALVWVDSALSASRELSDTRLYSYVIQSLVFLSQKRFDENVCLCERLAPIFFGFGDAFLTGSFCTNVALSLKNVGRRDEALRYLELARKYHEASGHRAYLGTVENNLAQLYKEYGRFSRAHVSADAARRLFRQVGDRTREGFLLDTKALIYVAESEFDLALKASNAAVKILRKSENYIYLIEALQTKSKIHIFLNDPAEATATLNEVICLARVQIGEEYAAGIFEDFRAASNEHAQARSGPPETQSAKPVDGLRLVLPVSLADLVDIQALWINNTHLEHVGLRKGSLAVIARAELKRGDLAALSEIETGLVSCGFYDEDFGIICLEGIGTEPQLFDAASVKILGKIVGVCSKAADAGGAMRVEPLAV